MSTRPDDPLSTLVQREATRHRASERLKAQIRTTVAMAAARDLNVAPPPSTSGHPPRKKGWRAVLAPYWSPGPAAVGGFALGVVLCMALILPGYPDRGPEPVPLTGYSGQLVSEHVQALGKGPLFEVATTDRHTVKPWFQGKLDYAPPVRDLSDAGFPLAGARIDHVDGRDVAVLVFRHRGHVVSLYVSPSAQNEAVAFKSIRGFQVGHWSDGSMAFWMVADMDAHESVRFVQAWSNAEARH
jgi:anti-sigma factor RsiW